MSVFIQTIYLLFYAFILVLLLLQKEKNMSKVKISKKRHLVKAITWSALASVTTFFVGMAFGLKSDTALMIVVIDRVLKFGFYYIHERTWFSSNWGVIKPKD